MSNKSGDSAASATGTNDHLPPLVARAVVHATVRDGDSVAVLDLVEPSGATRQVHLCIEAAWQITHGLVTFLRMTQHDEPSIDAYPGHKE